ncbi:TonB-dependent receptor [Olivibacter sp. SDN3]|uniref:TonB-dependent receptor n=1 Tax=Olivibacter sp. SDN3 TaxID=2764720 RepID=UPI0016511019|nr:TonB-dependent receptor [Olivibacter sp. SDN3]QNL51446.1 TonB-dependent receptor [Olivibacter sp. SDN3]
MGIYVHSIAQQDEAFVTGKLLSSDAKAAPNITVLAKGTNYLTRTNEQGIYTLSLPAGSYELQLKCLGILDQTIAIKVKPAEKLQLDDIVLKATAYDLNEVVVTGQFEPQSLKNSVYRIRTIGQDQILARASTSVENVLNTELGIRFSNDMALGESGIELMGMGGRNVKVMVDGLPIVDRGDLAQSLSQIDINTIERIEIVEGPMAVSYGTDALAGVINIITKKVESDQLLLSARLQEETIAENYDFLQNDGIHNANISALWGNKGWKASVSGSRNNAGGYVGGGSGAIDHWMPKDQWFGSGSLGYGTARWDLNYRLDYNNEDILNLGNLNTSTYRQSRVNYLTDRWTHQLQGRFMANHRLSFNFSGSYQDYERRTRSVVRDYRNGTTELSTNAGAQDTATFLTSVLRLTAQYTVADNFILQPGLEYRSDKGTGQRIDGDPRINDYAFFISGEWGLTRNLLIRPGMRFIYNSVYDAPPVIPSINAKWSINDQFDLRASYGRGFRSPALRELYFTFFDANHAVVGNPDLKAEHSNSYQASLSWSGLQDGTMQWMSTLNGFYNDFNDQINTGIDPSRPTVNTYINIDKFRTAGGTWENSFSYKEIVAKLGFSYIGRYNRLADEIDHIPSMRWTPEVNAVINYHIPKWKAGLNLYYKFNGQRIGFNAIAGDDGRISARRFEIQSYHTADLTLNKVLMQGLTLSGGVRNLFDVTTLDNTSLGSGGAHATDTGPIPISYGRSYFLGLKYDINIRRL